MNDYVSWTDWDNHYNKLWFFIAMKDQKYEGVYCKNFRRENYLTNDVSITAEFSVQSTCSKYNYMS